MKNTIKLIAVDLDGTLLNSRKEIPPGFIPMVNRLYKNGIRFVAASGRQYYKLVEMFQSVADKLFFFSENGGLIFDGDQNIFCRPIREDLYLSLLQIGTELQAVTVLSGIHNAYICNAYTQPERDAASIYYGRYTFSIDPISEIKNNRDSIVKVAIYDPVNVEQNCMGHFSQFKNELNVSLAGRNWIDIMRADVDKGVAMKYLQQKLDITPQQCMAFGDYLNDLEMLNQVEFSYAMANSHPDIITSANYRAPSNDDDGVMRVLNSVFTS